MGFSFRRLISHRREEQILESPIRYPGGPRHPDFGVPKLGPLRPRFLLESVEHGDRIGRFSFIGFGDGLEVTSDGHAIDAGSTRIETDGDRSAG